MSNLPDLAELHQNQDEIIRICRIAWQKGLMAGWSGNASMRLTSKPELLLITTSGSPKGLLQAEDLLIIDLQGEAVAGKAKPSSESRLHSLLYERFPQIEAILHTHPPFLQALELALREHWLEYHDLKQHFLNIRLYEAELWRPHLTFAEAYPPGSPQLAYSAAEAVLQNQEKMAEVLSLPLAIWLPEHGLCAAGKKLLDCLCLTEELEHLAQTQLLSLSKVPSK